MFLVGTLKFIINILMSKTQFESVHFRWRHTHVHFLLKVLNCDCLRSSPNSVVGVISALGSASGVAFLIHVIIFLVLSKIREFSRH